MYRVEEVNLPIEGRSTIAAEVLRPGQGSQVLSALRRTIPQVQCHIFFLISVLTILGYDDKAMQCFGITISGAQSAVFLWLKRTLK